MRIPKLILNLLLNLLSYLHIRALIGCNLLLKKISFLNIIRLQLFNFNRLVFVLFLLSISPFANAAIAIPEIDVSDSTPSPSTANGTTGNTIDFTQEDIEAQGAISVLDFISKQGSLQIESHSNQQNQTGISIHGFGNNASTNTLILVDGIPLSSFSDIGPNINSILVDSIASISILPGSYGTLYGDQAVGGVINITTQIPDTPTSNVQIGVGNMSQKLGEFFISRPVNQNFKYSVGGLAYDTSHDTLHNMQNNYNLNAQAQYTANHDIVKLSVYAYQTNIEIPDPEIWHGESVISTIDNFSDDKGVTANINNAYYFSSQSKWDSTVSLQDEDTHGNVGSNFDSTQNNLLWHNRWTYHHWLNSGFDIQTQNYTLNNTAANIDDDVNANVSDIFAQLTLPILTHIDFILGGRLAHQYVNAKPDENEHIDSSSTVPVDEEGIIWRFATHWRYYLRHDANYRFAKADEKVWVSDNVKGLKTQTGDDYETGIHWKKNRNAFSLGLYRLDLKNEIAYDPQPTETDPFGKMSNLDPTRRVGIDVAETTALTQHYLINVQAGYVNPYFSSGVYQGNQIPSVSKYNASASLTYQQNTCWSANITETYHSSFYATNDDANQGDKMPAYFLTNINFNKNWKIFTASLEVNNLFNKHFVRFADYFPPPSDLVEYYPADGINMMLKLKARFS